MFDEVAADFLAALKYVPDWFVTSKMIKKLLTDKQMMTQSVLMNIVAMPHFVLMKWVFLILKY